MISLILLYKAAQRLRDAEISLAEFANAFAEVSLDLQEHGDFVRADAVETISIEWSSSGAPVQDFHAALAALFGDDEPL